MKRIATFLLFLLVGLIGIAQPKGMKYKELSSDDIATISYGTTIIERPSGEHIVWVKVVYHDPVWQEYIASSAGIRIPVQTTLTKVWYDPYYSLCMVRQVLLFSKEGKLLYNTGEDSSAGWGYVNASDPVGIVGEHLGEQ